MRIVFAFVSLLGLFNSCQKSGVVYMETSPSAPGEVREFQNITFIWIPAGTFEMGSRDPSDSSDQRPVRQVEITKGYWLSKYEITQRQWQSIMKVNSSPIEQEDYPVTNVSWYECVTFSEALSKMDGKGTYRLPTEAEWEYACKAGKALRYPMGEDGAELNDFAWHINNSEGRLHSVGTKKPNAWGLHDMSGNAMEWCFDSYQGYSGAPVVDPVVGKPNLAGKAVIALFPNISDKVWRGGSFDWKDGCHCAYRSYGSPSSGANFLGLRIVRES